MDSARDTLAGGLPHSEIPGSTIARISPGLIAACHALHRLSVPRHPPDALKTLDPGYGVSHIRQNPPLTGTKTTPQATLLHEDTLPHKADEHPRAPIATGDKHDANETPASVTLSSPVKEQC